MPELMRRKEKFILLFIHFPIKAISHVYTLTYTHRTVTRSTECRRSSETNMKIPFSFDPAEERNKGSSTVQNCWERKKAAFE